MGKNHRHKKNLKSEKSKIKLKSGKTTFLPKGQNVSDLSFKIRPIVLPEQLKIKENELLSSRKLNLKDILNRLNHYNATVKYENCKQLKELVCIENDEFLKLNLSNILTKLCPLTLSKEQNVRREAIKVLNEILKASTSTDISSFFGILSSYLKCAMTHINQNIQEDSLLLLDALLLHVPDLVAENSHKILINFFTLISKLKSDSNIRTLAENLKSKYTGIKWRIQVLIRLKKILEAIDSEHSIQSACYRPNERIIDATKTNFAPIYVDKYDNYVKHAHDSESNNGEHVGNYIDTLIPLLNETWLEVAPSNVSSTISGEFNFTTLRQESASTLHCLLSIFHVLYQLADSIDKENRSSLCFKFKNKTCSSMFKVMLQSFPYVQILEKQQKKESGSVKDSKCVKENLLICYLFSIQNRNMKDNVTVAYAEKILDYLNFCLLNRNYVDYDKTQLLWSVIKVIVEKNLPSWRQSNLQVDMFVENILTYYLYSNQKPGDNGTQLLFMLYDIIDASSGKHQLMAEKCCGFILSDKISSKMLDSLLLMVKKNAGPLQESLRNNLALILGNIKHIKVVGIEMEMMKVVRILSLFNYVQLHDEDVTILQKFGDENPEYRSVITSIVDQ